MPSKASKAQHLATPNDKRVYEITRADLPLCCPMPGMSNWNSHPRVYLPIVEDGGETQCPYCSARFILRDKA